MNPKLAGFLLRLLGWKSVDPAVPAKKCILLGAPHTSIWDFIIAYLHYAAVGGHAKCMVKKELFVWPLGPVLRWMGGVPVDRSTKGGASLVRQMIKEFDNEEYFQLAIAIEGTRKPVTKWKTGFHTIAKATGVPVYLGFFDWGTKTVGAKETIEITDDVQADLRRIRKWYRDKGVVGKYPENFVTGNDLD